MATFDALLSRYPLNIDLGRPDVAEYAALAAELFPDSEDVRFAAARGSVAQMA